MIKRLFPTGQRFVLAFALLPTVIGIIGLLWATNLFGWRAWRIQEVQGFIGALLPDEAADVRFATQSSAARIVWLRFNLPRDADITPFLQAAGITDPLRDGFTPFPAPNLHEVAYSWWEPATATTFDGLYWNTGDKIIEVLVDRSDDALQVVYVRAYAIAGG